MIDHIQQFVIPAAYSLLPETMRSDKATAMLLAIGLHESDGFSARRQYHNGPARGFWQFEQGGGVKGVLRHPETQTHADAVIDALRYRVPHATLARQSLEIYDAITHNDTLACCFARLLLWTLPAALPTQLETAAAWQQYLQAWQPGAFKRGTEDERRRLQSTWGHCFREAWLRVAAAANPET